jgi:hypothetical protein
MSVFEITKSHLVGEIEDFPMEVVERMVYEQANQRQKMNPTVFAIKKIAGSDEGGFSWALTEDGYAFWEKVISKKDFDLFFSKYPRKTVVYENKKRVYVYAVGSHNNAKKVIDGLIEHGGINQLNYTGSCEDWIYYIEPTTNIIQGCDISYESKLYKAIVTLYTPLEIEDTTVEVSMEDIAKMMGVNVSDLRIKK